MMTVEDASSIEDVIIEEFQKIAENPKRDKVNIEHSPEVERFAKMLFKDKNWRILLSVIKTGLENPIIVPSYDISPSDIEEYVRILAERRYECSLKYVSRLKSQTSEISGELYRHILEKLREFLNNRILLPMPEVLKICSSDTCKGKRKEFRIEEDSEEEECEHCGSRILKLFKCSVNEQIKRSIYNNQFLEIYVKECLRDAGLKLVYVRSNGKKVSTSITYTPWPNRRVEIDVAAVKGRYIAICECKTVKVTQNVIDEKLPKVEELIKHIKNNLKETVGPIKVCYFLITTDEVDINLKAASSSYLTRDWLTDLRFIEGDEIPILTEKFKKHFEGAR